MNSERLLSVTDQLESYRRATEEYILDTSEARSDGVPPELFEAMEYSLRAGGKRLRPALCLAAAARAGVEEKSAMPMALGLEMLHTATLIHDDLPCMDDDDMRRGMPSNHAKFGETLALLAGDALFVQSLEFPMANLKDIPSANVMRAMHIFAKAIGPSGVCGGQVLDVDASKAPDEPDYVRRVARLKTGALIQAAVLTGAALGNSSDAELAKYAGYAAHLGSAFQIVDDILDVTSTAEVLGKTPGKDARDGKVTHVSVYGLARARELAEEESEAAKKALAGVLPEDDFLVLLPEYLVHRTK